MGTKQTFIDKWTRNPDVAFRQTVTEGSDVQQWILRRNGFATLDELRSHLAPANRLLDAGCGNGRVTALLASAAAPDATIVGVDLVAAQVARENLHDFDNVKFADADLLGDLAALGGFDFIYCQEVLHHTGDAPRAFANLSALLNPGGEIAIYVYREKAPLREFADDYIRDAIAPLPYEDAMEASRALAELGRSLAALGQRVTVPDVPVLGIRAGEYDVQRLIYHHFLKCFWSDELSEEENALINFDWYHPVDCTRHTMSEVLGWFETAGLIVQHQYEDEYGITVRGRRTA